MKLPNRKLLLLGFVLTVLAQLAIPLKMVYDCEMTSINGTEYKFRTRPIDPTDPFRGKYITLDYEGASVRAKNPAWADSDETYVYIRTGSDGFAHVTHLSHHPLDIPNDYFKAKAYNFYEGQVRIEFPFDRYYMEESKAYEAELAYRDYNQTDSLKKPAYAVVAVREGNAVLKEVIIDGIPMREYVLKMRENK